MHKLSGPSAQLFLGAQPLPGLARNLFLAHNLFGASRATFFWCTTFAGPRAQPFLGAQPFAEILRNLSPVFLWENQKQAGPRIRARNLFRRYIGGVAERATFFEGAFLARPRAQPFWDFVPGTR